VRRNIQLYKYNLGCVTLVNWEVLFGMFYYWFLLNIKEIVPVFVKSILLFLKINK
jgi:hypothetical protein